MGEIEKPSGKGVDWLGGQVLIAMPGMRDPRFSQAVIFLCAHTAEGAMGVVYLGKDPKIGRTVAIKTMALSQEFDADELEDVKARFFREAETAGRLNHPNIVTIYDVGEERHDPLRGRGKRALRL
ncbi:MAG: hypothetical protein B7X08_06425 [Acidocella sp. 20-63-7]|nr:MAG: hypothetical protein B7X08_06425 [Acidocella sp. 20-63-7]